MADNYTIPLGLDPKIFAEIDRMEAQLGALSSQAKNAGSSLTSILSESAKNGDIFNEKLLVSTANIAKVQQAARSAGTDLEKAFAPERIKTSEIDNKVNLFVAKMKDVIGKPVDFKFNLDNKTIDLLTTKLKEAKGQMEGLEITIDAAKAALSKMSTGDEGFAKLAKQISDAERFLNVLKEDVVETNAVLSEAPAGEGAIATLGNEAESTEPKVLSLKAQLRQMKEQLAAMEIAGLAGTAAFNELSIQAGELADQAGDTSQRIKALASDTKGLDAGISAVRGLAGAFAVGQGALAAFGEQNEEAAKAIQKVQGAMAILQGIQEIANVLNKDSTLMIYLSTFARKTHTTAVEAEAVAIEGEAVATEAATVAAEEFTVALLANPIIAVIAALAAITIAVYLFAKANKDAGLSVEALNDKLKMQKDFFAEDLAIIQRRQALSEAETNFERRNQSALTQLKLDGLQARLKAQLSNITDQERIISQSRGTDEKDIAARKAAKDELTKLELDLKNTVNDIKVEAINKQKQLIDEEIKLQLDLLKEKQIEANAEIAIRKQVADYITQISNAKLGELREGEEKEIGVIRQSTAEKIKALDIEAKARLKALNDLRAQLFLDLQVADENGKKVINQQITNNATQITLEKKSAKERTELKKILTEAELVEEQKIRTKYAEEERDLYFDVQVKLNALAKDSANKEIALLEITKKHELDLIDRTNKSAEDKALQRLAVEQEFEKKKQDALLDFNLRAADIEKVSNENRLISQKGFFDKSRDGQALANLLILQNELETEKKKLELLQQSGKELSDQEVVNAKNRILKLQDQIKTATKDGKAQNIYELLFPDDDKSQKLAKGFMSTLNEVGKAVQEYTNMLIQQYQSQIDAANKRVSNDDDNIKNLQDQLDKEQALKEKGLANNVAAIKADMEQQRLLRDKDLKERDEAQKRLEKVQKAQAAAQTVLQIANLITASTEIYLSLSELGPIGVALAGVTIAAMVAAFAASKISAANAANQKFATGGEINGRSHDEGGEKYYSQTGGGVVELEAGEFVVRKKSTQKYKPLLKAINEDNLDDFKIAELLAGLGIHIQQEEDQKEALKEARIHTANTINFVAPAPATPTELISINENIGRLVKHSDNTTRVEDDGDYLKFITGNRIIRRPKK